MGLTPRDRRVASYAIVPLTIAVWMIGATIHVGRFVHADQSALPGTRSIKLGAARAGSLYSVTIGVKDPAQLQGNDSVHVTVNDAKGEIESKWLHPADLDFYLTVRPRTAGPVTVNLSSPTQTEVPEISATLRNILQAAAGVT